MNLIWDLYWPVMVTAALLGLLGGVAGHRTARGLSRGAWLGVSASTALAIGLGWHGLSAEDRFVNYIEESARMTLAKYEMPNVTARLERGPIRRTLVLTGPADDFQRRELIRILGDLPGVRQVRWDRPLAPAQGL